MASDKEGFHRDSSVIASILHNEAHAEIDAAVEEIYGNLSAMEKADAFISEPYHTDRYVRAVVVAADHQAKHGTGTRAAQKAAKPAPRKRVVRG